MAEQLHKRFTDEQVKLILELYLKKVVSLQQALQQLGCSEQRFYQLLRAYRRSPEEFTIAYGRNKPNRRLPEEVDRAIREQLKIDRQLIADKKTPLWQYNYRAIRDEVERLGYKVSDQTVRNRAKEWGFWMPRTRKEKAIPREVVTEAPGMLLQHDSSTHKWSPYTNEKWALITTLDDYSRYLVYADFAYPETTWAHIRAVESVILNYGVGLTYYVDSHSIFRFVCHRGSFWRKETKGTDEVLTQWKRVVQKCNMQVWHALSAGAKGKVERPYRWLQDRIIRRCAREDVRDIKKGRLVLQEELRRYNKRQVHSTTLEIPELRLRRAIKEGRSCFKPFKLQLPYESTKDVFCLHDFRKVNGYNQISWKNRNISIPIRLPQGTEIELHEVSHDNHTELRLWYKDKVLKVVHFNQKL